ncbi:ABC-type multidrug transport system fused ATPase/permease subunit [Haloactinopolyspora alba]|uniref:ABC-type multidrug transport system fused ATPase/permease subunit n=1 Tax=Haloactinopolyspora alba TaxID=648780 RepID=A0A2P8E199_9ACTN|nr:ABC transporter ATP-binding protein [Haloactinopolyspora alba]PSL03243.1 ABC-type multidrug transport system fused ATPase/permease subunit [Haloactinopolyspora alba]
MSALPVASPAEVRAEARRLFLRHRRQLCAALAVHVVAAAAGLAGPFLLGRIIDSVTRDPSTGRVDLLAALLAGFIIVQALLTRVAINRSLILGERVFAELRETFIARVLSLPLSTVERAGTGDLVARTTGDIDAMSRTVRFAIPEILVAVVTTVLTLGAAVVAGPLVAVGAIVGLPLLYAGTRWYLNRARDGYLWERAAYATLDGTVSETVDGARTIEALGLSEVRVARTDDDLREAYAAERRTLFLRTVWFPTAEMAYVLPVVATLAWGAWLASAGHATAGQVTAVVLYMVQIVDPVDRLVSWLDELQVGMSSFARVIGVADVPPDRQASGAEPDGEDIRGDDVRYAYVEGQDVLHGVSLRLAPGERLAMVGPSGAGKSTLGRLLAGIHPTRTGSVDVGGVPLVDLPVDQLRREVVLVTQEHHVFVGTLRDNLALAAPSASDDELRHALAAVDALDWADALPDGLDTVVGSGGHVVGPAFAQQIALARIVLADPHTLVLDEATSLLDPRAARHLERSLSAVLRGRTVIAIAHRLHTAHDADRVAVVEDGVISELGSHDELVARRGAYAALWESWHGTPASAEAR